VDEAGGHKTVQQLQLGEGDPGIHALLQQRARLKGKETSMESTLHTKLVKKMARDLHNFVFDKSEYDWELELPTGPFQFNCSEDGLNTSVDCPDEAVDHSLGPSVDFEDTNDTWHHALMTTTDDGEGSMATNTTTTLSSTGLPTDTNSAAMATTKAPLDVDVANASEVEGTVVSDETLVTTMPMLQKAASAESSGPSEPAPLISATQETATTSTSSVLATAAAMITTPPFVQAPDGPAFTRPALPSTSILQALTTTALPAPSWASTATTAPTSLPQQVSSEGTEPGTPMSQAPPIVVSVSSTEQMAASGTTSTPATDRYRNTDNATTNTPTEVPTMPLAQTVPPTEENPSTSASLELTTATTTSQQTIPAATTTSEQEGALEATTSTRAIADVTTSTSTDAPAAWDPASIFRNRIQTTATTTATVTTTLASVRAEELDPERAAAEILRRLR